MMGIAVVVSIRRRCFLFVQSRSTHNRNLDNVILMTKSYQHIVGAMAVSPP